MFCELGKICSLIFDLSISLPQGRGRGTACGGWGCDLKFAKCWKIICNAKCLFYKASSSVADEPRHLPLPWGRLTQSVIKRKFATLNLTEKPQFITGSQGSEAARGSWMTTRRVVRPRAWPSRSEKSPPTVYSNDFHINSRIIKKERFSS